MPQSYMPSSPRSLNPGMLPKLHKSLGLGSATPAHLRVICCVLTDYLQMRLSVLAFAHSHWQHRGTDFFRPSHVHLAEAGHVTGAVPVTTHPSR